MSQKSKPPPIDARTGRSHAVYKIATREAEPYTAQFSRALGLRPAQTQFGKRRVMV